MLVNGTTLGYAVPAGNLTPATASYTNLAGLKEVPDMGVEPELVDNTALADSNIHNELGIGDAGDMEYTFRFVNSLATDAYRVLKGISALTWFQHQLTDGTIFRFSGVPSVRLSGGGVNDPQEFVLTIALQSDITVVNPA